MHLILELITHVAECPNLSAPNALLLSTACFPISHIADGQYCAI